MPSRALSRTRLNMRIPEDLLQWAKGFAHAKNTNLTQLFVDYLTTLREEKEFQNGSNKKAAQCR